MPRRALIAAFALIGSTAASAQDYRARAPEDEVIYFALPDRFENGDARNDRGGLKGDRLRTGLDPSHRGFYHGGDLKGLTARLDYIQQLGASAIWLGPIFKNKPVQGEKGQETAGYHGYWITDFNHVDPHFGSDADFRALVDAAHARGIKVYMDIVANHTADVIHYREEGPQGAPYRSKADYPGAAYTPYVPKGEEKAKSPAWLNDPAYYHNRGATDWVGESAILGDFSTLDDLATEHPRVVAGFIEIYGGWIDRFGVDGFRIDTARHVNPEFWRAFVPAMQERAKARGIPNFHIFGEVATGDFDPALLASWTRNAGLPSVLDFAFARASVDAVSGKGGTDIFARLLDYDVLYEGGAAAAVRLPTFLGNHDAGRFSMFVKQLNPGIGEDELLTRMKLGHALLLTMRGAPVIYYGDEQGFVSDGGDQQAREDMFASKVAEYNDNDLIGTAMTTAEVNFDTTHPLFRLIAEMAHLRRSTPALTRGHSVVRAATDKPGLLAVSRFDPDSGTEVVLAFNTSNAPLTASIAVEPASLSFKALKGDCPAVARAPGSISINLPPLGFAVCAATR